MQNDLVFRAGSAKRAVGWLVFLGAAAALVAMTYAIYTHPENQVSSELWSAAVIGVFLIGLMWAGMGTQRIRWAIEGENIVYHGLFKNKTIALSELAGFGQIAVIVGVFPLQHVDLYNRQLKIIARLPVSLKDWPKAEAWFAERFRYVVNDGSPALPKPRFADTPKI